MTKEFCKKKKKFQQHLDCVYMLSSLDPDIQCLFYVYVPLT